MVTETAGEVFNGSMARTVSNRKSHGTERNKSMTVFAARSEKPPKNPGAAPMARASSTETAAAAGASNIDTRVPCNSRAKRSRPRSSVPSQCWLDGAGIYLLPVLGGVVEPRKRAAAQLASTRMAASTVAARRAALIPAASAVR